jgi:hypothetical protein
MRDRELIFVVTVVVIVAIVVAVLSLARSRSSSRIVSCFRDSPLGRIHLLLHTGILGSIARLFAERRRAQELLQLVILLDLQV